MYRHSALWHVLWLATPSIQLVIAWIMVRRKTVAEFPMFFSYTIFHVFYVTGLFVLDHDAAVSAVTYWRSAMVSDAISAALRFAIVYEIFRLLFLSYPALTKMSRSVFKWGAVLLVLGALLVARYSVATNPDWQLLAGIKVFDRSIGFVQCGMIILLFGFSRYLGISWRIDMFGICLGLGIISASELALSSLAAQLGFSDYGFALDLVSMSAYLIGISIWLVYMLRPEQSGRPIIALPSSNLESWNRELERLLQR